MVRDLVVERAAEEGGEPVPVRVIHRGLDLLYVICDLIEVRMLLGGR